MPVAQDNVQDVSLQYKAPKAPKHGTVGGAGGAGGAGAGGGALPKPQPSEAIARPPAGKGVASGGLNFSGTCHVFRLDQGVFAPIVPEGWARRARSVATLRFSP